MGSLICFTKVQLLPELSNQSMESWWFLQPNLNQKIKCPDKWNNRGDLCTRGGTWTRTAISGHRILSPACLPISPPGQTEIHLAICWFSDLSICALATTFLSLKKIHTNSFDSRKFGKFLAIVHLGCLNQFQPKQAFIGSPPQSKFLQRIPPLNGPFQPGPKSRVIWRWASERPENTSPNHPFSIAKSLNHYFT